MADSTNSIVYKLDVDLSGLQTAQAAASLESLKRKIIETEQAIAALKLQTKGNGQAQLDAAGQFSQLQARLSALRTTFNDTARSAAGMEGFTSKISTQFKSALGPIEGMLGKLGPLGSQISQKFGLIASAVDSLAASSSKSAAGINQLNTFTQNTEKAALGASKGIGGLLAGLNPVAVVAGVAGAAILAFGGELLDTAAHLELVDRKARVVFGESFPQIEAAAKANANAIGLTTSEYLALASSQQVVFQALGLTTDQTLELTPRLLEMADGLADFSGGQLDTAQAADILKNAIQGNVKGLSEFGIPVKRSKDELEALSKQLQETNGYTKDQADALATTQLVLDQVGDSLEEFTGGEKTLADKTDEANARFREQKDALANALAPAFNAVTTAAGGYLEQISKIIEGDARGAALAKVLTGARLFGSEEQVKAIELVIDAQEKLRLEEEKRKKGISLEGTVTALAAEAAGLDDLIEKHQRLSRFRDGKAQVGDQKQADDTQKEIDILDVEIAKRKEANAAVEKLGSTYDDLSKKLTALQETRKTLLETDTEGIKENDRQIAAVEKQLKVFDRQKATLSDAAKAAERFADSQKQIANAYELSTAKIEQAFEQGYLNTVERQKLLLDLEQSTAQARLTAREQFAQADGKISEQEQEELLKLSAALDKAKQDVQAFAKEVEKDIKDKEARLRIVLEADLDGLQKEVADAIAADDLTKGFEKAFASSANEIGADLRAELLAAAQDGTIDFEGLIANGSVPKELVEDLRKAYEKFRLETEKGRIELVKKQEEEKLARLKARFEELSKLIADLESKKVDATVAFTVEDEEKLTKAKEEFDSLDGKIVTATLEIKANTEELEGIGNKIKEGLSGGKKSDESESILDSLFGEDADKAQFYIDNAVGLANDIGDAVFEAKRAQIERTLALTNQAISDERDSTQRAIEDQVEAGLITEEEGRQRRLTADREAEAKRREAAKKAFEDKKRLDRAQATLNFFTELAGLAAVAPQAGLAAPVFYGIMAGIASARYVANLAAINGTSFARKGTIVHAQQGQIAQGPSHEEGGIQGIVDGEVAVELEGGEAIISKKNTERFAPILSAINAFGGDGVPFAADGGVVSATPWPTFALGGRTTRGSALVNFPLLDDEVTKHPAKARLGRRITRGTALVNLPDNSDPNDVLLERRTFAFGGMVPPVFAGGGISLIPPDGTIANRRQLEQATAISSRVVKLNGEQAAASQQVVLHISELDAKTTRIKRAEDRVSFGV